MRAKVTRRVDRRPARTRRALHDALISLILRKGYEALTIQQIIDEADVGRATFYAHYSSKQDLLRSGFETLREELLAAKRKAASGEDVRHGEPFAFSLAMFEHAYGYKKAYRALVGHRGGTIVIAELRRVLSALVREELPATRNDAAALLTVEFVVGAFLTVLTWWLERKSDMTPAQVDSMFRRLVIHGIGSPDGRFVTGRGQTEAGR